MGAWAAAGRADWAHGGPRALVVAEHTDPEPREAMCLELRS